MNRRNFLQALSGLFLPALDPDFLAWMNRPRRVIVPGWNPEHEFSLFGRPAYRVLHLDPTKPGEELILGSTRLVYSDVLRLFRIPPEKMVVQWPMSFEAQRQIESIWLSENGLD